ncbi:MAG: hypothetical protein ACHREM_08215 [Polyangiales bacterium]
MGADRRRQNASAPARRRVPSRAQPRASEADIGGVGEATFETWTHEVGITPNKAFVDRKGWDYHLVLPRADTKSEESDSLDVRPAELICYVQVKTRRLGTRSVPMALSNWERLTKWPAASFVALLDVDNENKVCRASLVPIGETLIADVLRRLRSLPIGRADDLHKRSMVIRSRPDDLLDALSGKALLAAILRHAGSDFFAYLQRKRHWLETVGYDDAPHRLSISFPDKPRDEMYDEMADFAIGDLTRLAIEHIEAKDVRFGIEKPLPSRGDMTSAYMELPSLTSIGDAVVEVFDADRREVVRVVCRTYSALAVFPFLPSDYRKFAFVCEEGRFVVTPRASGATFGWRLNVPQPNVRCSLATSARAAQLYRLLTEPTKRNVRVRMTFGEKSMEYSSSKNRTTIREEDRLYPQLIEDVGSVASMFRLPESDLAMAQFLPQATSLKLLSLTTRTSDDDLRLGVLVPKPDVATMSARTAAILLGVRIRWNDLHVFSVVAVTSVPAREHDDGGLWVTVASRAPRIVAQRTVAGEDLHLFEADVLYTEAEKLLTGEGVDLVLKPSPHDSNEST